MDQSFSHSRFHCCATCIHYVPKLRKCSRLGYDTSPKYQFNCWTPKQAVKNLMEAEEEGRRHK